MRAVRFDGTTPLSRSWDTYPILRFTAVPVIDTAFVGATENASLGAGEAAQGPTTAAIANAVSSAVGIRVRHLPLDRDKLEQLIQQG